MHWFIPFVTHSFRLKGPINIMILLFLYFKRELYDRVHADHMSVVPYRFNSSLLIRALVFALSAYTQPGSKSMRKHFEKE